MELKLSSNFSGKPVSVVVPIEKVIEVFWPKDENPHYERCPVCGQKLDYSE